MPRQEKLQVVKGLKERFSRGTIIVVTDYRGLSAKEMTELRHRLREVGVEYKVVKNTLARFAAIEAGREQIESIFSGPVAIAFASDEDVVKLPRALNEYIRSLGSILQIKGGMLGNRLLSPADILTLSNLPSRDILISQVIRQMRAPLQAVHNIIRAPLRGIIAVLQARINQLGGENVTRTS